MPSQLEIYTFTTYYHENITQESPNFQTEGWLRRSQEAQDKWRREKLFFKQISGDTRIDELIYRIESISGYPTHDNQGVTIFYQIGRLQSDISSLHQQNGLALIYSLMQNTPLHRGATLDEEGIQDKEKLVLYPGLNAGGPDPFTIVAALAAVTQVVLMVIDMWLRRTEGKANSTKKKRDKATIKSEKAWGAIKEIRIEMSDGNWVKFDNSPQFNLKRLRSFIEVFNVPSESPKPIKVVLVLNNGSKAFLNVSNESEGNQQIEKLLEFLRK